MKKLYEKPLIEIEAYQLDSSIAANCGQVISMGPEAPGKDTCKEFEGAFDVFVMKPTYSTQSTGGTPFYSDGAAHCDCYYSSGSGNYFTS